MFEVPGFFQCISKEEGEYQFVLDHAWRPMKLLFLIKGYRCLNCRAFITEKKFKDFQNLPDL